jgi:hypothetical protein
MIHINTEFRVASRSGLEDTLRDSEAVTPYKMLRQQDPSTAGECDV